MTVSLSVQVQMDTKTDLELPERVVPPAKYEDPSLSFGSMVRE